MKQDQLNALENHRLQRTREMEFRHGTQNDKTDSSFVRTVRYAVKFLNATRGRGDVVTVKICADGTGTATRRTYSGIVSTFRFRVRHAPGTVRVFALGTSKVVSEFQAE